MKDIAVDVVKLDLKFLGGDFANKRSRIIIASVNEMIRKVGMDVTAEGVENKEQADMLYRFGCFIMQGHYFSRLVLEGEYEAMIKNGTSFQKAEGE